MKNSRFFLWVAVAFILGYAAHATVVFVQMERRLAAYQEFYQNEFRVGEDYEKAAKPWRERGLELRFFPERSRFDAILPSELSDRLHLSVEVDENHRIKKVIVYHPIRM
jgi:hypothetical protein